VSARAGISNRQIEFRPHAAAGKRFNSRSGPCKHQSTIARVVRGLDRAEQTPCPQATQGQRVIQPQCRSALSTGPGLQSAAARLVLGPNRCARGHGPGSWGGGWVTLIPSEKTGPVFTCFFKSHLAHPRRSLVLPLPAAASMHSITSGGRPSALERWPSEASARPWPMWGHGDEFFSRRGDVRQVKASTEIDSLLESPPQQPQRLVGVRHHSRRRRGGCGWQMRLRVR